MADQLAEASDTLQTRYAIVRELGRGGMATVYLAEDRKLQRRVAIKLLHPELAAALGSERFLREIEFAARLSHPHILPLHDAGEASGRLFYTMSYVEGESLRHRLEREPQLPVDEALRILQAVAGALDAAHRAGVVHRDIKPENILLANDPGGGPAHPMVADFGIARALTVAGSERLTETGLALGTPAYMSPEQGAASDRLDGRSDIYALGCVAYEMLAGAPPFTGPTAQAILARHAVDPVPPLRTVRSKLPTAVEAAVERALAKVPADRFSTAGEFARALVSGGIQPRLTWRVLRTTLAVAIALGALAAGGLAFRLLRHGARPAVPAAATTIAVLPFVSTGGDTALVRLGRDLAVTLSASLDRLGGIQSVDRLAVASGTADRSPISLEEGAMLSRRLGAGSFLRGTLVPAGGMVRLDAGLYRTSDLASMVGPITVTAPRDSIGALTDSVAWRLLRDIWQQGNPPSPSLGAVTTRSLPALRAFLEGERRLAENRWDEASLAFQAAIEADSTFVIAHYRYYATEAWGERSVGPRSIDVVRRNLALLPERDRLLIAAHLNDRRWTAMMEGLREVTERYPDYWPAWLLYADALVHGGPRLGHDWTEGYAALQRVVALNPDLVPAWEHIARLTYGRDEAADSRANARLEELGWEGARDPYWRLESAVFRAGGTIPAGAAALRDSVAIAMVSDPDPKALERTGMSHRLLWGGGWPAAQIQLNRRALTLPQASPEAKTTLRAANSLAWAARGRWDSALVGLTGVAKERPGVLGLERRGHGTISGPILAIESYALAVVAAWLGAGEVTAADASRAAAVAAADELSHSESRKDASGRIAWLDGLLGLARQDRSAIRRARQDAARSGFVQAALVDRSLAAFETAAAGDRRTAGRELADLEERCADFRDCNDFTPSIAVQRLAAAQWLAEAGDDERARRLIRWQDAVTFDGWLLAFQQGLAAPTYLLGARLEEQAANRKRAAEYYRQFLRRYDQPMPSQAHLVDEAKAALVRLAGEGGR
jgi:tRNA A-37 threonylcarbamoyl transferase component Bud32